MMIPRQKTLSRRTVLRGAGVALGLPWLEAMVPSALARSPEPADAKSPVRMAVLYMANGVNTSQWTPEGEGRDFRLSPTLQPLAGSQGPAAGRQQSLERGGEHRRRALRQRIEPAHLHHHHEDARRGHQHPRRLRWTRWRRSASASETPLPSLELGIEPESTGVDANVGYTRVYGCHIAWSSPTTPLARETNPRSVYARLFRAASPAGQFRETGHAAARPRARTLQEDALQLGAADQARVDEYLSIVRSLETRMERASDPKRTWKPLVSLDSRAEADRESGHAIRSTSASCWI